MVASDNVLAFVMQNALSRAYPSSQASNQLLQFVTSATDNAIMPDAANAVVRSVGYPYGYGEWVSVAPGNVNINEQDAIAFILRLRAFIPSGSSVTVAQMVGGNPQTLNPIDPSQVIYYGDMWQKLWTNAYAYAPVGTTPWGTPTNWTDTGAWWVCPDASGPTADPPGMWLARKYLYAPTAGSYGFSVAADAQATVSVDGQVVMTATGTSTTATGSVTLSKGLHLVGVTVVNYGTSPNPTGLLISITDPNSNIIENGSGQNWETVGYINNPWSMSANAPLFTDTYYLINQPSSVSQTLQITTTGSPTLDKMYVYCVPPWKWDEGGQYDATANNTLPITVTTVRSA